MQQPDNPAAATSTRRHPLAKPGVQAGAFAALGLLVMLIGLGRPSLWTDEAATAAAATKPLDALWHMLHRLDLVHGFYYLLMHPWVAVWGQSEFALRLPSALAFAGTVGLSFALMRRLAGVRAAVVTAVFVLVLPSITRLGLEARGFALASLLVMLSMDALLRVAASAGRARLGWWVVYTLASVGMVAFEVYTLMVLPAHLLLVIGQARATQVPVRRLVRGWVLAVAPVVVAALGYVVLLRGQSKQLSEVYNGVGERALALAGALVLGSFNGKAVGLASMVPLVGTAAVLALGVVLAGWAVLRGTERGQPGREAATPRLNSWQVAALGWWAFAGPVVVWVAAMVLRQPFFAMRYWGFAALGLVMLAVIGLLRLRFSVLVGCGVVMVLCCLPMQWHQRQTYAKVGDEYRKVAVGVRDFGAQAVIVDRPQARGVALGYPQDFVGVADLSARAVPAQTDHLWGYNLSRAQVAQRLREVRPQRLAVLASAREPDSRSFGLRLARAAGCTEQSVTPGGRFSAHLFTCPSVP